MEEDEYSSQEDCVAWKPRSKRSKRKDRFTESDDEKLKEVVYQYGTSDWKIVAAHMKDKNARQCKERWTNYLDPNINCSPWIPEDDKLLLEKQKELGSKWVAISKFFVGRTDAAVKNRWQLLDRKLRRENDLLIRKKHHHKQEDKKHEKTDSILDDLSIGEISQDLTDNMELLEMGWQFHSSFVDSHQDILNLYM